MKVFDLNTYRLNVGVPGFDSTYQDQGKVATFINVSNSWSHFDELYKNDIPRGSAFGHSVDHLAHSSAVTGAPVDDRNGIQSGSAHFYSQESKQFFERNSSKPSDLKAYNKFGFSVAHRWSHSYGIELRERI